MTSPPPPPRPTSGPGSTLCSALFFLPANCPVPEPWPRDHLLLEALLPLPSAYTRGTTEHGASGPALGAVPVQGGRLWESGSQSDKADGTEQTPRGSGRCWHHTAHPPHHHSQCLIPAPGFAHSDALPAGGSFQPLVSARTSPHRPPLCSVKLLLIGVHLFCVPK